MFTEGDLMDNQIETLDPETEKEIEAAIIELHGVQFCDNTWTDAIEARDEVIRIIRDLAKRLAAKS
jgi:hypothetical protein